MHPFVLEARGWILVLYSLLDSALDGLLDLPPSQISLVRDFSTDSCIVGLQQILNVTVFALRLFLPNTSS